MNGSVRFTLRVRRKDNAAISEFELGGILYQFIGDPREVFVDDLVSVTPCLYQKYYDIPLGLEDAAVSYLEKVSSICNDFVFQMECVSGENYYLRNFADGNHEIVLGRITYNEPDEIKF